jgi:chromosome segregation ATPase
MSRDPYLDVRRCVRSFQRYPLLSQLTIVDLREVENTLSQTRELYTSYLRLKSTSNNQQVISEARQELETSLGLLEVDIEDLEDSVTAVEESGTRWGLSYEEVQSRRRALEDVIADVRVCQPLLRCGLLQSTK